MVFDATELTAVDAVSHIRDGDLRAEDYAAQLLARHQACRDLNLVTWIDEARLLESARAVDLARARGDRLGPLGGLPIIVKDNIDTPGFPTSAGTPALKTHFPQKPAPVMEALFRQGALLFAKANMHELARGGTSSNPAFGPVRNPYDPSRIPGGSSGGTAAALAARVVAAGLGTDTAGSVRIPAALCGVVALRPTIIGARTRYSQDGVVPLNLDFDTVGPMARTVADLALLDEAMTGDKMPPPPDLPGIRIGIPRQYYWEQLDPAVSAVMDAALGRLREAGVVFVEVDIADYIEAAGRAFVLYCDDLAKYLAREVPEISFAEVGAALATPELKTGFFAPPPTEEARAAARAVCIEMRGKYRAMFRATGIAAMVFPTVPIPAPPIRCDGDPPTNNAAALVRNTRTTCSLGVPGLSLAAGLTASGLPVGLELDALDGQDSALLALGMAAETVLGYPKRPPMTAPAA